MLRQTDFVDITFFVNGTPLRVWVM